MLSERQCVDSLEQVRLEPEVIDDPLVCQLAKDAQDDVSYKRMLDSLQEGVEFDSLPHDHPLRDYANVWSHLAMLESEGGPLITVHGDKIVSPASCRKSLLETLHSPDHSRFTKMLNEAKCHYYWPTMKEQCRRWCQRCEGCQDLLPKNNVTKFNMEQEDITQLEPMQRIGVDPFDIGKKSYLAITDKSVLF